MTTACAQSYAAPAKLNLMLRVVGRRADGYHLLQTLFRFIDRADTVTLRVRPDGEINRLDEVPGVPAEADLALRAARLLQNATGTTLGADIGLDKRIPLGAGLGGGSSDAATVLMGLNSLWGTGLDRPSLQALGVKLGADVPVFIFGQSAYAEGIGEILSPAPLPQAWYVVLTPPLGVATARVFSHPDLKRDSKPIKIRRFSAEALKANASNDLQGLVCRLYPEVDRHLKWLTQHNPAGPSLMTGSGAAVFSAFACEAAAKAVFDRLPAEMSGFVARGLDRHPLWTLL